MTWREGPVKRSAANTPSRRRGIGEGLCPLWRSGHTDTPSLAILLNETEPAEKDILCGTAVCPLNHPSPAAWPLASQSMMLAFPPCPPPPRSDLPSEGRLLEGHHGLLAGHDGGEQAPGLGQQAVHKKASGGELGGVETGFVTPLFFQRQLRHPRPEKA